MNTAVADEELLKLIREVQSRKAKSPPVAKSTWVEAFGMMPDDEISREAARLGEEWRKSEGQPE